MILRAALLSLILAGSAAAQSPAAQAQAAVEELDQAAIQLDAASSARDRVKALTATIRAFEDGLAAMRDGLRQAAIRERALSAKLTSQEAEISSLLSALQTMGRADSPTALLHPSGAVGTARAGMLLADIGPALNASAKTLRFDLEEVQTLRSLQQNAANRMSEGLTQLQTARAGLNQAMAERTDLPQRFTADPMRAAILIASSETLAGFASGLQQIAVNETAPPLELTASRAIGDLPLPVQGVLLRRAGEADAAGVARPGLLLATRPEALVTTPTAATIRYAGPLLDFGQVVILEPQAGSLLILAGLAQSYGAAGQVISEGSPVGLMGTGPRVAAENPSTGGDGGGTGRSETLYIEVRQDDAPIDPATWFALGPGE
ncbi:MAG: peptidase M23 [Aliishimia sp.]